MPHEHHPSEAYSFPSNEIEQAREELRLYPTTAEFHANIVGLISTYHRTAFARSLIEYAQYAAVSQPTTDENKLVTINQPFLNGAILATHTYVSPLSVAHKRYILRNRTLPLPEEVIDFDLYQVQLEAWLVDWIGGSGEAGGENWDQSLSEWPEEYGALATLMAARLYPDNDENFEKQNDFMAGFTLASDQAWSISQSFRTHPPT